MEFTKLSDFGVLNRPPGGKTSSADSKPMIQLATVKSNRNKITPSKAIEAIKKMANIHNQPIHSAKVSATV